MPGRTAPPASVTSGAGTCSKPACGQCGRHLHIGVVPRLEPAEHLEDQPVVEDERGVGLLGGYRPGQTGGLPALARRLEEHPGQLTVEHGVVEERRLQRTKRPPRPCRAGSRPAATRDARRSARDRAHRMRARRPARGGGRRPPTAPGCAPPAGLRRVPEPANQRCRPRYGPISASSPAGRTRSRPRRPGHGPHGIPAWGGSTSSNQ